ncbi:MAG: Nif3-like dinuclear metal center hexameric protein, partial [Clostridium sp.]|nr:Nif3-like dinuclear metal center hexameric protein [Clostridium sp.]
MKCSELIEVLKGLAPEDCACEWDNPGLLAGRSDKEVKKVYIALDATDQVVEAAIEAGAHMLLTHHPLIFKAIKQVNDQNFITRRLVKLIQSDISYYAMPTNFDAAPGCMAALAARRLG